MFLDIGVGILIGILFDSLSDVYSLTTFVLWGMAFALSPDLDFIIHFLKGGKYEDEYKHRNLLHNPLIFWSVGSLIMAFIEPILVPMFLLGSLSHFIHDSIGIGFGVRWLFPFSRIHYAFLYRVRTGTFEDMPKQLVYKWDDMQVKDYAEKYHDYDWFRNIYLKWHPFAIVEFAVFIVSLVTLYFYAT
jgi:hypothetical protein